jgi:hypothetical protein
MVTSYGADTLATKRSDKLVFESDTICYYNRDFTVCQLIDAYAHFNVNMSASFSSPKK